VTVCHIHALTQLLQIVTFITGASFLTFMLSFVTVNVIMMSVIKMCAVMLNGILLFVDMFDVRAPLNAESRHAVSHHAEYHYAESTLE